MVIPFFVSFTVVTNTYTEQTHQPMKSLNRECILVERTIFERVPFERENPKYLGCKQTDLLELYDTTIK